MTILIAFAAVLIDIVTLLLYFNQQLRFFEFAVIMLLSLILLQFLDYANWQNKYWRG